MFSEKAFRAWQAQRGAIEDADRGRIRELAGAEVDRAIEQGRREREAETAREQLVRSLRHATAVRQLSQPQPGQTLEQRAARRAEIRRGVEAEMSQFDADGRRVAGLPPEQRSAPAGTNGSTVNFGGNRYAVEGTRWRLLGPSQATRQVPPGTRVGEVRTVQGFRYQWNGRAWLDGEGRPMPVAAA
ncbi:hypothetical protein MKK69_30780 [Methylobacterium sp. J-026]|uniref:hypothetical protein n=1 Tax=Methylobacterium sp. J-026 TaxID=2836624 RepID=UPI001FBA24C9|nr:hypothetical protein [Methylobacterium sp. J-026]MCJ2138390.1 hypothetical protein [Methylobacterium sp. J-026]